MLKHLNILFLCVNLTTQKLLLVFRAKYNLFSFDCDVKYGHSSGYFDSKFGLRFSETCSLEIKLCFHMNDCGKSFLDCAD